MKCNEYDTIPEKYSCHIRLSCIPAVTDAVNIFAKLINAMIEIMIIHPCCLFFFFFNVKHTWRTAEIQMQHSRQMTMTDAAEQVNDRERES